MFSLLAQVDLSKQFAPAARFPNLGTIVSYLGQIVALVGGILVALTLVYAAYKYLTANDEAKNIDQAKQALTWGIVGLIVIVVAYWLVQILTQFVGVDTGIF